jgi:hypothetical protein
MNETVLGYPPLKTVERSQPLKTVERSQPQQAVVVILQVTVILFLTLSKCG